MRAKIFHSWVFFTISMVITALVQQGHAQLPEWRRYEDSTLNVSLIFPKGKIIKSRDTIKTEIGPLIRNHLIYNYPKEDDLSVFMLSITEYPDQTVHHDSTEMIQELFKVTVEEAVNAVDGQLMYDAKDDLATYPGTRWKITYNKGTAVIQSKAWIRENYYYTMQVAGSREYSLSQKVDQFFKSFRFLIPSKD